MKRRVIRFQREREYPMSVSDAWRLLADTDHLNRVIGLPAIAFSQLDPAQGQLVRQADTRAFGLLRLSWREDPFEWVRERRYVVRREFDGGPIKVIEHSVELEPSEAGVRVVVGADFTPANLAGHIVWRAGAITVRNMISVCDRSLARREAGRVDPIPVPKKRRHVDQGRLDELMDRLRDRVPEELVGHLRDRIVEGSDDQLRQVRPYAVADLWGADRSEVLRLFLHATKLGLFQLRWELMCPICGTPKDEAAALERLPARFHCEMCGVDYPTELDQRVELRFSVDPAIRTTEDVVHCIGGPMRTPHVVAQQYLRGHETRQLAISTDRPLRLRVVGGRGALAVHPDPDLEDTSEVRLTYAQDGWIGPRSAVPDPRLVRIPSDASLQLRNQTGAPLLVVLEEEAWGDDATTAAEVTALQEFRDLFGTEVLSPGQQLAVRDMAILFSNLRGATSLYEDVGDAAGYGRVNRHFDFMTERIAARSGAAVKTIGDGVMGAFNRLTDAVEAAIDIQLGLAVWCAAEGIDPPLVLRVGVHHGPVVAVNGNGRLDYFGRTVNLAAQLGQAGKGGDVVLLRSVHDEVSATHPGELDAFARNSFTATLRGYEGNQELTRILVAPPAAREMIGK